MESIEHALPAGTLIDERYRIDSVLGEGGFAITYKAFDTRLEYDVAIKEFLPNDLAARSADTKTVQPRTNRNDDYSFGLDKFLDEARTLASLRHPHIVQVTNFIKTNGTGYLVMTYDEGVELGDWLKSQPSQLSEESVLDIVTPILEGLTEVHQQGLLHRDIKPGNIFLRQKSGPMLIDFGAARQAIGEKSKSISAIISQGYAPPEQYTSRGKQGAFTDLYAIGATLYRLIIGKTPVDASDRSHEMMDDQPDPLTPAIEAGKGKVSDWLLQLTDQLLQVKPRLRPQSAQAVLDAIHNKTTAVIDAAATKATQNTNKKTRVVDSEERFSSNATAPSSSSKNKTGLYAGIAAAVLLIIGAGYFFSQQSSEGSKNSKGESIASQKPNKPLAQGKAILFVESTPSGAEVFLDNNLLGKTPYQGDNLPQGIFELTLKHDTSSDLTESLQLTDNLLVKKNLTLKPATGNYSVFSTPTGAAVSIDGKDTGQQTPASLTGITAGEHTLSLSKDAYYPKEQSIYIRKNENLRGDFVLEGGDLVQHEGKWLKPEEKTRLVAAANVREEKRKAEQKKQRLEKIARAKAEADRKAREEAAKQARIKAEQQHIAALAAPTMVRIPAGTFRMGDIQGGVKAHAKPVHSVSISAFFLSETEVTFANWDACVNAGGCSKQPSDRGWGRGRRPVMEVNHDDITTQFIPWLNKVTGKRYRLPSEAEWEYAARAGSTTKYSWGNSINCSQASFGDFKKICIRERKTVPVKSFSANAFGLYDMHGNVKEWVQDCWNGNYNGAPSDGSAWRGGNCNKHVTRGGSWSNSPNSLRSAYRYRGTMSSRSYTLGFRLAQDLN